MGFGRLRSQSNLACEAILGFRVPFLGYIVILWGLYWDNGKENGNYYSILG